MTQYIESIEHRERALNLTFSDGRASVFHYIWLRDNCSENIHKHSSQRLKNPREFHENVYPKSARIDDDRYLEIVWAADEHISRFSADWLLKNNYSDTASTELSSVDLWDAASMTSPPEATFEEVTSSKGALKQLLEQFVSVGITILRGVPVHQRAVLEAGQLIGSLWRSHWGESFDVVASNDPLFIGFTNLPLASHVDDAFCEPVPPVLLLHCLINEAEGGETTVCDGFKLASVMRERDPKAFALLSDWPVEFFFHNKDYHFEATAPLIRLDASANPVQIRFSNQSLKPLRLPASIMEVYYDAYCKFSGMAESDEFQIRFRLQPGDLVILDNHRLLHGRRGFAAHGARHLTSCFVARDALLSRLAMLNG